MNQKESKCLMYGFCPLLFKYEGFTFCLSEVLGQGCETEKLKNLEKEICKAEEDLPSEEAEIPLFGRKRGSSSISTKREDL
jgi:hypothetical protein